MIIRDGDRFLVGRRSPDKERAPGCWCPVSGQVEPGETEEEAVARECREEIGVEVRAVRKLDEAEPPGTGFRLHVWLAEMISGTPRIANGENTELRWLTVPELRRLTPVFQEDIDAMQRLLDGEGG